MAKVPTRKERSIEKLRAQREIIGGLKQQDRGDSSPQFQRWLRDTRVAIEHIFGNDSQHTTEFTSIGFGSPLVTDSMTHADHHWWYVEGLRDAEVLLDSLIGEIEEYWDDEPTEPPQDSLTRISRICARFHLVATQLLSRREGRPSLVITDEYDVQDLLHALLKLEFEDVRPEEHTPSRAGAAARIDFLLKAERILVEAKKTRESRTEAALGDELIVDIERYKGHPDCETLLCFVYDPESRLRNPRGLEADLTRETDGLRVVVIVAPRVA